MFYIRCKSIPLDLPVDFSTDLVIENPLLQQERVPSPYTTSFDFPQTISNMAIFENPDRVNLKTRTWEFDSCVLGYGAHVIYTGILIIQEISGSLKCNFQASDDLSRFKVPMSELDLGDYSFGMADLADRLNSISDFGLAYYNFFNDVNGDEKPFTAAPIKLDGSAPESRPVDGTMTFMNILWGQNNFFNGYGVGGTRMRLKEGVSPTDPSYLANAVKFPQIRISELARILLDLPDEENPFLEGEMNKLVLTAHYHPNFRDDILIKWKGALVDNDYPTGASPAEEMYFNLGSFQSTVTAAEVFRAVMNMFCMTIFPEQLETQRVYRIRYNKDVINDESFVDWNAWLGSNLILSREQAQEYIYGYADFPEKRPELDPEYIIGTIADIKDAPVNPDTSEQLYYIQSTEQLILKKLIRNEESLDKYEYEVKYHGLEGSKAKSGFDIKANLGPLPLVPTESLYDFVNRVSNVAYSRTLYQPVFGGQMAPDYKPSVMMYQGMVDDPFGGNISTYPYLSYHNYSPNGHRLGELSLAWRGPDGLIQNYHFQFKAWVEKDRLKALAELIMSPYNIKFIKLHQKTLLRGKLWWIQKLTIPFTIKKIEPAQAELIEAPIPGDNMPSGSGSIYVPDSGDPDPTGTCYTIAVDTQVFDFETDDFDVQLKRPGESITVTNWQGLPQYDVGTEIHMNVCSEEAPTLLQSGVPVGSVSGVSISSGGSCLVDGECVP